MKLEINNYDTLNGSIKIMLVEICQNEVLVRCHKIMDILSYSFDTECGF